MAASAEPIQRTSHTAHTLTFRLQLRDVYGLLSGGQRKDDMIHSSLTFLKQSINQRAKGFKRGKHNF